MRYSFVAPKKKPRVDLETKIIAFFMAATLGAVAVFVIFVLWRQQTLEAKTHRLQQDVETLRVESERIGQVQAWADRLIRQGKIVATGNTLQKESIENLFDLVPDQITLTRAEFDDNRLTLYGVTPSKEVYNHLLLAPLKSVFLNNVTTFYAIEGGWFRFVSVNKGTLPSALEAGE